MAWILNSDPIVVAAVEQPKDRFWIFTLLWVSLPILIHTAVLRRYLVDAPVLDDYNFLDTMYEMARASDFSSWLKALVSLQNEHRAATTRLIPQLLASVTGSVDFRLLNVVGTLFMLGTLVVMVLEHRQALVPAVIGAGAFLLLQWSYNEALMQASGALPHLGVVFFAFAGLFMALRPGWQNAIGVTACGTLATFSQANGLLVLPIAAVGCFAKGFHRRAAVFAALTVVLWWFYFSNYVRPPNHPSLLASLHDPITAIRLFLVIIGGVSPSLLLAQVVGGAILGAAVWVTWRGYWRAHPTAYLWFAFIFLSAATVSAARSGFGLFIASRYAVNAALLMTLLLFAISSLTGPWNRSVRWTVFIFTGIVSLMMSYAALPEIRDRNLKASLLNEWNSVPASSSLPKYAGIHYPSIPWATRILNQASENGVYLPPKKTPEFPRVIGSSTKPGVVHQGGVIDSVVVNGRVVSVRGWSSLPFFDSTMAMIIYPANGVSKYRFDHLEVRQDVALTLKRPELLLSGFHLSVEYSNENDAIIGAERLCVYLSKTGHPDINLSRRDVNCQ